MKTQEKPERLCKNNLLEAKGKQDSYESKSPGSQKPTKNENKDD